MATKMKGIYKGFKFISHLFGNAHSSSSFSAPLIFSGQGEREMEIGLPTDVKHVAHIGLDGADGSAPSWMNEFKTGPDFSLSSLGSMGGSKGHSIGGSFRDPTWTSQDFEGSVRRQKASDIFNNFPPTNPSSMNKKQRRKKGKSASTSKKSDSSPKSVSSRSSRKSNLGQEISNANT